MKNIVRALILCLMVFSASTAFAADQIGIYLQPKLVYGLTQIEGVKGYLDVDSSLGSGSTSGKVIGSKTDDAFGGSLALGYDFSKQFNIPLRAELEYSAFSDVESRRNTQVFAVDAKVKTKIGIQTLFVNAYWDIDTGTSWQPYLTGGLGMAFIDTKGTLELDGFKDSSSKTKTNFAWNLGLGIGYDINPSWTVDL